MRFNRLSNIVIALGLVGASACNQDTNPTAARPATAISVKSNPCGAGGTLQLGSAQTTRIDCSNGGTTVTLSGAGASYLIVPQFATDQVADQLVSYRMTTANLQAASLSASRLPGNGNLMSAAKAFVPGSGSLGLDGAPSRVRPMSAQRAAERFLRTRAAAARSRIGVARSLALRQSGSAGALAVQPPDPGSVRSFHVASSFTTNTWKTVGAKLAYAGNSVLVYIDTLAPANGFTAAQFAAFGQLFDQTLYPIDTAAFGPPSDIDQNGRVIVLMSPVVNADTPTLTCATTGYTAGFFDPVDFDGPTDVNSNQAEIFYTVVPDLTAQFSCAHSPSDLGLDVPATFLHELQHLINFSQHVVVSGGAEGSSWMDEGMSIVAEELGSVYYEQKCPPPACRTSAAQLFPDSAQGFIQSFFFDSYLYALLPDTASVTLHTDDQDGFSWRGGTWLLMRWLGDQMGTGFYRKLERGPANGVTAIEQASGQSFPALFANFGLSLYTDSLPGLPRSTAAASNRFISRNVKQLWARLFATSGPSSLVPLVNPVQLFAVTADTSLSAMSPGTMTYFRLDTPATSATVSIQFSAAGGVAFATALRPQLAVFRLPTGQ
jgi:hypothetical protein